ncbi:metallo-dependent phosphatases family [Trichomonas vaginalis G3]|uniref:metallo-dependent phosphatases family n=1 Tax=Trichomonas vaginalis (strain ATCC PRA-98 / G3) TaxID=412133 RepID=UPI0021E606B5|nr:metallo-dependent phosphatases family [Trichomonas vaginalis G3]KAI5549949.1 metallo-dependent phosphatases family [Trichomonas vaginalis G3]
MLIVPKLVKEKPIIINRTIQPTVIGHLTDLHLNPEHPQRAVFARKQIEEFSNIIKPTLLIISGDLVDGTETKSEISQHRQFQSNWDVYKDLIQNATFPIIAAAGNHDEHALERLHNKEHLYIQNVETKNFFIEKSIFHTENGKIRVILLNPFSFPTSPMPYGLVVRPSRNTLDLLENELDKVESDYTILTSHFPSQCIFGQKSSTNKKFEDIIKLSNSKVTSYLVGHFHMPKPFTRHIGGTLEIFGSTTSYFQGYGLLSFDGGSVVYSFVNFSSKVKFIVTNPPPEKQFISSGGFLTEQFRVRVVVYDERNMSLKVFIDKKFEKEMEIDLKGDGFVVYGLDVHTSNGMHSLKVEGDGVKYETEFLVSKSREKQKEKSVKFFIKFNSMIFVLSVIVLYLVFTTLTPFILKCQSFTTYISKFGIWLTSETEDKFTMRGFMKSVFLGPFFISFSILKIPRKFWICYIVTFVSFFCLPMYFMRYDDTFVMTLTWCVITRAGLNACVMCFIVINIGIGLYFVPFLFLGSIAFSQHPVNHFVNAEMLILNVIPLVFIVLSQILCVTADGPFSALFSPLTLFSLTMYVLLSFVIWRERLKQIKSEIIIQNQKDIKADTQQIVL